MKRSSKGESNAILHEQETASRAKKSRATLVHRSSRGYDTTPKFFHPLLQMSENAEEDVPATSSVTTVDRTLQNGPLQRSRDMLRNSRETANANAIQMLTKPLLARGQEMTDNLDLLLSGEQTIAAFCLDIATAVEDAIYQSCWKAAKQAAEYNNKVRSVAFNLGRNASLASEVLWERIEPARLAEMTTDEMANKELKEYMEKVRIQSEINITLVKSDAPRIRKTHKGEEIVEDLQELRHTPEPENSLFSITNRIEIQSRGSNDWNDPEIRRFSRSPAKSQGSQMSLNASDEDTPYPHASVPNEAKYTCDSDDSVNSLLYSPSHEHTRPNDVTNEYFSVPKKELQWVGRIEMSNVASLCTVAQLAGGPEHIAGVRWSTLLDEVLNIDSCVSPDAADRYLKQLGSLGSISLVLVCLTPMDQADKLEFLSLFERFGGGQRYAVVEKHYFKCITSVHLIFLNQNDPFPGWFASLSPPCTITSFGRKDNLLLVVFGVIRDLIGVSGAHGTSSQTGSVPGDLVQPLVIVADGPSSGLC